MTVQLFKDRCIVPNCQRKAEMVPLVCRAHRHTEGFCQCSKCKRAKLSSTRTAKTDTGITLPAFPWPTIVTQTDPAIVALLDQARSSSPIGKEGQGDG